MKSVVTLLFCLWLSGCAFRQPDGASAAAGDAPAAALPPYTLSMTSIWQEGTAESPRTRSEKRPVAPLRESAGTYAWDLPIHLPALVPDSMDFKVEVPLPLSAAQTLSAEDVVVQLGESGTEHPMFRALKRGTRLEANQSAVHPAQSVLSVSVSGLREAFPVDSQSLYDLRLTVHDKDGRPIAVLEGPVMTPPSAVGAVQTTSAEHERGSNEVVKEAWKRIRSGALDLYLLQVVRVENPSAFPIEIDFPVHPEEAKLWTRTEGRTYVDKGCSYEVRTSDETTVLTQDIYLIPWAELTRQEIPLALRQPLARPRGTLTLAAGETGFIGVYGSGGAQLQAVEQGRKPSLFSTQSVSNGCYWWCTGRTNYVWWYRSSNFGDHHYQACMACSEADPGSCNECYATEPPGDKGNRFCWMTMWQNRRQQVTETLGTQTHPILLDFNRTKTRFLVRWSGSVETREFPAVKESSAQMQ